ARYELLLNYAQENDIYCLLTAHHADDQAETILFRLFRGSGIKGLAGMKEANVWGDERLHARPLLNTPKADLIAVCQERHQDFVEDPSNTDPRFARTRLRELMPQLAQEGLDRDALLRLSRRAARADEALDDAVASLLHETRIKDDPFVSIYDAERI